MLKTFVNGLLTVLLLAGAALAQTTPERIRISYSSGGMTSIDLFIARDLKYFQQQNLSAELIRVPANLAITAGISGDIDVLGSMALSLSTRRVRGAAIIRLPGTGRIIRWYWVCTRPMARRSTSAAWCCSAFASKPPMEKKSARKMRRAWQKRWAPTAHW